MPSGASKRLAGLFGYNIPKRGAYVLPSMFPSPLGQADALGKFLAVMNQPGEAQFSVQMTATQITDGLSQTAMMTEIGGRPDRWRFGMRVESTAPLSSAWADYDATSFSMQGTASNTGGGVCLVQCDNNDEIYSFHAGMANCLFADGHVAPLRQNADPRVILALVTPNQGESGE